MVDDNDHPFNTDVLCNDALVHFQKQLTRQKSPKNHKDHQSKELIDLLSQNNTNNIQFSNPTASSSDTISDASDKRLKHLIRSVIWPIDHRIRQQLWLNILTLNRASSTKIHQQTPSKSELVLGTTSMVTDSNFNSSSSQADQWPSFVDTANICFYFLNESTGHLILQRILTTFALHHPDVTYCPTLEPFSALLLHYHNEHDVLHLVNRLLMKKWLCGETRLQWEANCNVFKKLLRVYYKPAAEMIDLRCTNTKVFYQEWFWWIFRYLPFHYLVKIMDCFVSEGPKVLFRTSLALVYLFTKIMKHESNMNTENMAEFCEQIPVSIDRLLEIAFHIRNFKRSSLERVIKHEERLLRDTRHQSAMEEDRKIPIITNLRSSLIAQIPNKSILTHQQFEILWNWLPVRLSLSRPVLAFTTEELGFRLQTLLNRIDELEHSILVVKATNGEIFGAFCAGLWSDRHQRTYFGFGESFLFTLLPKSIKYSWVGQDQNNSNRQTQAKREMFLFVNNEKMIIGGGNGDGLCIDQSLCEGRTAHCDTFDNEPLCSQGYFSISVLEMIAFDFSLS